MCLDILPFINLEVYNQRQIRILSRLFGDIYWLYVLIKGDALILLVGKASPNKGSRSESDWELCFLILWSQTHR